MTSMTKVASVLLVLLALMACTPAADSWADDALARVEAQDEDWEIARRAVIRGKELQLDMIPIGDVVATIGSIFVGTAYVPHTLELPGEERLVVNLREFDCVTLVEHVLALSRLVITMSEATLADPTAFRRAYAETLTKIRYRHGTLNGYPDRLHYFSEWISDGERKGLVEDVTLALGGTPLTGPIDFMSKHPDAYWQLADPAHLEAIRRTERRLSDAPRYYIPQTGIASRAGEIRNGDIIAATSTVPGLDIAHTGIAMWRDGALHLLHAPLVGSVVEISERPLAERIRGISGQDGIMVARPLEPAGARRAASNRAGGVAGRTAEAAR